MPDGLKGKTYCQVAHDLLDKYADAVKRVLDLQAQQLEAVIAEKPEATDLAAAIDEASMHRRMAKHAYLQHVHSHSCSTAPIELLRDEGVA